MIINHHDHDDHHDHPSLKIHDLLGQASGSAPLPSLVVGSDVTVPENRAYHVIMLSIPPFTINIIKLGSKLMLKLEFCFDDQCVFKKLYTLVYTCTLIQLRYQHFLQCLAMVLKVHFQIV